MNPKYQKLSIPIIDILKIKMYVYFKQLVFGRKFRNHGFLKTFINSKLSDNIKLQNNIVTVSFMFNEKPLQVNLRRYGSDIAVFNQIFINPEYEVVKDFFISHLNKEITMIDVGGNIGLTSIYFKTVFPNAKIITLEPEKSNYQMAVDNATMNNYKDITILNKGMWTENSYLEPDINFRDGLSWSFTLKKSDKNTTKNTSNQIETITLVSIIQNYNLQVVDVLKIDIEGGENDLLNNDSFLSTLQSKVKFIVIEIHPEVISYHNAFEKLKSANFTVFQLKESTVCINNRYLSIA